MFFRSRYIVRHFGMDHEPAVLEVETAAPPSIKLLLRLIKAEEIKQGYQKNDWVALLSTEESIAHRVASDIDNDKVAPTPAVIELSTLVSRRMHLFLEEFLRLVRWRNGVYGHHNLIRCSEDGLQSSVDGTTWKHVIGFGSVTVSIELSSVPYQAQVFNQIKEMIRAEEYEPIGHELLREAWNLKAPSPRSALMLGVAALEVGVKDFVARMVPKSEWLCFELPNPPVVRMLEEYFPSLPVRLTVNGKVFIPKKIIDKLKVAVVKRNRVAHKGMTVVNDGSLGDILTHVQMALYLLDYYSGHSWAMKNIRDSEISDVLLNELKNSR
jgi:hypothetical protein